MAAEGGQGEVFAVKRGDNRIEDVFDAEHVTDGSDREHVVAIWRLENQVEGVAPDTEARPEVVLIVEPD